MVASSSVVCSIDSALQDIQLRVNQNPYLANDLVKHKIKLRGLQEFLVLCTRKLGGADVNPLALRIEAAVGRYAKEIHRLCDASTAVVLMRRLSLLMDEVDDILSVIGNIADFPTIIGSKVEEDGPLKSSSDDTKVKAEESWTYIPSHRNEIEGSHDEAREIIHQLTGMSTRMQVVNIWGMAGAGKTTLGAKIFNDPSIMLHFHTRARCSVSSMADNKREAYLELLHQIDPYSYSDMTDQLDLMQKIRRCLKEKRYLIFLDDVNTTETWDSWETCLPDYNNGSRILVTSRRPNVIHREMFCEGKRFVLGPLSVDESLDLLSQKLFGREGWPFSFLELGMRLVEHCRGSPLRLIMLSGVLAAERPDRWEEILDSLSLGNEDEDGTELDRNALEVSYNHLPNHLKPCLLYFGTFREGQEVSVKRLFQLWIAEGFVRTKMGKSKVTVAEGFLRELIGRSLVVVAKRKMRGDAKTCRINDWVHDLCMREGKRGNFFDHLRMNDQLSAYKPHYLRRLCVHDVADVDRLKEEASPHVRSLLVLSSEEKFKNHLSRLAAIIPIFKLVRVLDLEDIYLGYVFPSEIGQLLLLRYLSVRGLGMTTIPPSIGNLLNLETFVLHPGFWTQFPCTLWHLKKLRCLSIKFGKAVFPRENLEDSPVLDELTSLSGVGFWSLKSMEKQLRKCPNIRRLKCYLHLKDDQEELDAIVIPCDQLESLHLWVYRLRVIFDLALPSSITKLTLARLGFPWVKISPIGRLPNLEVLRLLDDCFSGHTWEVEVGDFRKLRFLELSELDIETWTSADDQFESLQKLVLHRCRYLRELPSCLEDCSTLETIDVVGCSVHTEILARQIAEVQMDYGNSEFKISIR